MNWELFWAALGSLSTMAACIIAIFQPSFQKIITKKKIITSFRTDMKAFAPFAPDMVNEKNVYSFDNKRWIQFDFYIRCSFISRWQIL